MTTPHIVAPGGTGELLQTLHVNTVYLTQCIHYETVGDSCVTSLGECCKRRRIGPCTHKLAARDLLGIDLRFPPSDTNITDAVLLFQLARTISNLTNQIHLNQT